MNLAVEVLATRAAARGGQCAGAAAWPRSLPNPSSRGFATLVHAASYVRRRAQALRTI